MHKTPSDPEIEARFAVYRRAAAIMDGGEGSSDLDVLRKDIIVLHEELCKYRQSSNAFRVFVTVFGRDRLLEACKQSSVPDILICSLNRAEEYSDQAWDFPAT